MKKSIITGIAFLYAIVLYALQPLIYQGVLFQNNTDYQFNYCYYSGSDMQRHRGILQPHSALFTPAIFRHKNYAGQVPEYFCTFNRSGYEDEAINFMAYGLNWDNFFNYQNSYTHELTHAISDAALDYYHLTGPNMGSYTGWWYISAEWQQDATEGCQYYKILALDINSNAPHTKPQPKRAGTYQAIVMQNTTQYSFNYSYIIGQDIHNPHKGVLLPRSSLAIPIEFYYNQPDIVINFYNTNNEIITLMTYHDSLYNYFWYSNSYTEDKTKPISDKYMQSDGSMGNYTGKWYINARWTMFDSDDYYFWKYLTVNISPESAKI